MPGARCERVEVPLRQVLEERRVRDPRRVRIVADRKGDLERTFYVDGDRQAWGNAADEWLAEVLPGFIRETSIGAEERVERILATLLQEMRIYFFHWTSTEGLRRWGVDNMVYDTQEPLSALEWIENNRTNGVYLLKDFHAYLDRHKIVRKLRDLSRDFSQDHRSIILCAPDLVVPKELEKTVVHYRIRLPGQAELKKLVKDTYLKFSQDRKIEVELTKEEFEVFLDSLRGLTLEEAERAITKALLQDSKLTADDTKVILERKKELLEREGVLEFFYDTETFHQVGGLQNLKRWLRKRKKAFSPEAKKHGLPAPKGILLLGVQGCGKSLCAKAVAQEWKLPLLRFDPSRLYDKYVGESERNLRKAMEMAEYMSPVVLWIDEIEKGFSFSTGSDADAGLSRRIFGTFLAWLQEKTEPIFVVATSNDIQELPAELLRKGRFDEIFFVDLPSPAERREILAIHLRRRKLKPADFDLDALAAATDRFSGAEIEQLVVNALYSAFADGSTLTSELLRKELAQTMPLAVTMGEKIEDLRQWAGNRCVPATVPEP